MTSAIQETGGSGLVVIWDKERQVTIIRVPTVDVNGRHYVREITVAGNNVVDIGRDTA